MMQLHGEPNHPRTDFKHTTIFPTFATFFTRIRR